MLTDFAGIHDLITFQAAEKKIKFISKDDS